VNTPASERDEAGREVLHLSHGQGEANRRHPRRIARAHPDPTAGQGEPWVAITTGAVEPPPAPVTLAAIKAEPKLKAMALVKYARLSVQPVAADEWKFICKMGGLKA
jgi:predicted RNA-binding protein with PUA-like domain